VQDTIFFVLFLSYLLTVKVALVIVQNFSEEVLDSVLTAQHNAV